MKDLKKYYFNTSHVVVYRSKKQWEEKRISFQYISCCSLSDWSGKYCPHRTLFQYISCCSLSRMSVWTMAALIYFNTSHVVVYRYIFIARYHIFVFQYISCCSLSPKSLKTTLPVSKFQYISCCSLSQLLSQNKDSLLNFNTSHVVVYQE